MTSEAFNALGGFNNAAPGQFEQITLNGGTQGIMRFAVKYAF